MRIDSRPRLRQMLIEAIFRRQKLWWTVALSVMALTVLVILFMPRRYESTAKLVVANLRTRPTLSGGQVSRVVTSDDVSPTQINSEADLLKSQGVIRAALGMPEVEQGDARQKEKEQNTVKTLQNHLSIDPVRESSIIDVSLLDKTPEAADAHLNAIVNAYLNKRKVLTQSAGVAEFFAKQAETFGNAMTKAQNDLTAFEQTHQLVDLDQQKKMQVERVASIQDKIAGAQSNLADQNSRRASLTAKLGSTPARVPTLERLQTNQYSQERLTTSLVEMVNKRDELLRRYPPTDRQILALNDSIATEKKALDDAIQKPAQETATDVNPLWQQVNSSLVASNAEVNGAAATEHELRQQLGEANARLIDLQSATEQYDVLKRRRDEAQTGYNLYVQKRDEARLGAALDQDQLFDVTLVQRPITSADPVRPKPVPYFLAGLVLAVLLASVVALYADSSDVLVYTPQQLDAVTGVRTSGALALEAAGARAMHELPENTLEFRRLLNSLRGSLGRTKRDGLSGTYSRRIAVTSAGPGDGVSFVARQLATEASRQTRFRVLLFDMAELVRRMSIERTLLVALERVGSSAVWQLVYPSAPTNGEITNGANGASGLVLWELGQQNFWGEFEYALSRIDRQFELMIFDCPSLRESTMAVDLDRIVDGYIGVIGASSVPKRQIRQMVSFLQQTRTPVLAYLLNRRTYPIPQWLYRVLG